MEELHCSYTYLKHDDNGFYHVGGGVCHKNALPVGEQGCGESVEGSNLLG